MIQTTRVYPMVCEGFAQRRGCCVDYQWDDTSPQGSRAHTPVRVQQTCAAHSGMTADEVYQYVVLREGGLWSRVEAYLAAAFPVLVSPEGFAAQARFTGSGKTRTLTVTLPGALANEVAMVQAWADLTFAPGDVVVT